MKRVNLVFISDDDENNVDYYDAVLIRENTIMLKYKKEKKLGIERSDSPYRVDQNGLAHEVGKIRGIEIELSEEGYAKDLEELASMPFSELTKYLKFGW